MYKSLALALQSDRYSHSELGDGTSVLTSLSDSKIISLNTIGTRIVGTLMDNSDTTAEQRIESLSETISNEHNIPVSQSRVDIDTFLNGLARQLHTVPDSTPESS